MQVAGENFSFPAGPNVCLPSTLVFKISLELSRPLWAGHGVADAL